MAPKEANRAPERELSHFATYIERMDTGVAEKYNDILPVLRPVLERFEHPIILSVGAGSGRLEEKIAKSAPHAKVIALDMSMRMEKTIWELIQREEERSGLACMETAAGRAERLPFATESIHAVIASSMVHHPASFQDMYRLGDTVQSFFRDAKRVLLPGGRLIIRDFMQSETPDELLYMRLGEKQNEQDANPLFFVTSFAKQFFGAPIRTFRQEVNRNKPLQKGQFIRVPMWLATEIAAHYSWANPRFKEEIKERYAYLPVSRYAETVRETFDGKGIQVASTVKILSGYPQHVNGRLDFFGMDIAPRETPVYTGVVGIEKV